MTKGCFLVKIDTVGRLISSDRDKQHIYPLLFFYIGLSPVLTIKLIIVSCGIYYCLYSFYPTCYV